MDGRVSIQPIPEMRDVDLTRFRQEIVPRYRPVVLRGLVRDWPVVAAAAGSPVDGVAYLERFDRGALAEAFIGSPEMGGRFFYRPDMSGFNFERRRGPFKEIVRYILSLSASETPPFIYVGSAPASEVLPGFETENAMPLLDEAVAAPRIWVGNESIVATHFDESDNIACSVAGRRRFTVFPPDQVANLYVGPLDFTMAGQPASMVSLRDPDLERYPRFADALAAAQTAELEPGDAIYIPALWWHQVEALDPFNVLVNYWWRDAPADTGSGLEAMVHGILALGTLPRHQREAWRHMFDQYVFRNGDDPAAHLAPEHRGIIGEPTPQVRQKIRQFLLRMLSRY